MIKLSANLPNFITLMRIASVPLVIWLIVEGLMLAAFWVFILAGISDALDGFIAKRFDLETELGKYLDPLADKALLVSIYVSLGLEGYIPNWLVILVVFRDIAIVGGAMLVETMTHSLTMRPLMISKINTVLQIIFAGAVLANAGYDINLNGGIKILALFTAVTTVISGFAYAATCIKSEGHIKGEK